MKKLLGIVVLGLLWCNVSVAKEIKVYHKDENSISITESFFSNAKQKAIAAKHCAQYNKFAFDFLYGDTKGTEYEKARRYTCSKSNLTTSPISGEKLT